MSGRVWLGGVADYTPEALRVVIARGVEAIGAEVRGNAVAVADWTGRAPSEHTAEGVVAATLDVLLAAEDDLFFVVTGRAAKGRSSRRVAREAGGLAAASRHGRRAVVRPADEARLLRYQLSVGERAGRDGRLAPGPTEVRVLDRVRAGWEFLHADTVVAMPKAAWDPIHGVTGAAFLAASVADTEGASPWIAVEAIETTWPDLVVTDAVKVGWGGIRSEQALLPLGVVLVADDPVAHDVVLAHIFGVDPRACPALAALELRGFGALDLEEVVVEGEFELEELVDRVRGFGPPPPRAHAFAEAYSRRTGVVCPVRFEGDDPVLDELAAQIWDDPDAFASLAPARETTLTVGPAGAMASCGETPPSQARSLPSIRPWGRTIRSGLADLSTLRDLLVRFGVAARPRESWFSRLRDRLGSWTARVRRSRRNRRGVPVVHARKIQRLSGRPWRRRWSKPAALEPRTPRSGG